MRCFHGPYLDPLSWLNRCVLCAEESRQVNHGTYQVPGSGRSAGMGGSIFFFVFFFFSLFFLKFK